VRPGNSERSKLPDYLLPDFRNRPAPKAQRFAAGFLPDKRRQALPFFADSAVGARQIEISML